VIPQLVLTILCLSTHLVFALIAISEYAQSWVLSSTLTLDFTHNFVTYLDDFVILSRPHLQPLPLPPVSPTASFNLFSDFDREETRPSFIPGNYLSLPAPPLPLTPLIPPSPPPWRSTQGRHENVHEVDRQPLIGYLSDPVFVRILPPNGPFISTTSWFLCEHEDFRHTQTYLTTTNIRTGTTTSSPVDKLTFYVTLMIFSKKELVIGLVWSR
jgi:hypothetical protein